MAEGVAAFYAVETVVEGAAVGAIAVSQSTTPLHLRFRKFINPLPVPQKDSNKAPSLDVVKGKAYVFGGTEDLMTIITLPSDIEIGDCDCQLVQPEFEFDRPLQRYSRASVSQVDQDGFQAAPLQEKSATSQQLDKLPRRTMHASTSIDSTVYILAGCHPGEEKSESPTSYYNCDVIYAFSTQTHKWLAIQADVENCKDGIPPPRRTASCSSTPHPAPGSAVEITLRAHGTIFLHGGYDARGEALRDTWAFDVNSRVWTQWPDLPKLPVGEPSGQGQIACVEKRLWRVGDGSGIIMGMNFEIIRGDVVGQSSGPHRQEVGVKAQSRTWEVISFKEQETSATSPTEKSSDKNDGDLPTPRSGAGFVPVNLGAGRMFLLDIMGQDNHGQFLPDVWCFQTAAQEKTLAAMKDVLRRAVGKETGQNKWARCDVVESTKEEGQLLPPSSLAHFAFDVWEDLGGGNVLLLGGVTSSGQPSADMWLLSVE